MAWSYVLHVIQPKNDRSQQGLPYVTMCNRFEWYMAHREKTMLVPSQPKENPINLDQKKVMPWEPCIISIS